MKKLKIGFAMCGSFCTFSKAINMMQILKNKGHEIFPIMSFNAYSLNTKFGKAKDFQKQIKDICEKPIINTIPDAEPIGPQKMVDIITVCPCTGNTLAKLCSSITDTPVTMAVKSQLRIKRPVVIALATNDALGGSAKNLGKMLNHKNIFFVPMYQDDYVKKPNSLVPNFDLLEDTIKLALENKQIQPLFK